MAKPELVITQYGKANLRIALRDTVNHAWSCPHANINKVVVTLVMIDMYPNYYDVR